MSLESSVAAVTARLREGRLPNEQAVSQSVVLRLLAELGWDVFDTTSVWPEYATGEGRVDFALCHPPSKPAIFIEVKQTGKVGDGVRQALEYAFHTGVPMIVVTDGQTWGFYLPGEQGSYDERRVYMLDLFERTEIEAAQALRQFLDRERVSTGQSIEYARSEYRSRNRRSQARAAIPQAWRDLVEQGDEALVELLATAVEARLGIRPSVDDVANFLTSLRAEGPRVESLAPPRAAPVRTAAPPASAPSRTPEPAEVGRAGSVVIRGRSYSYSSAKDAMSIVLRVLAESDPGFLPRLSRHPRMSGRKRRYLAQSLEDLYPDRSDLSAYREELPGGWLLSTNLNNVLKMSIIRSATEVAGLALGRDVVVDL